MTDRQLVTLAPQNNRATVNLHSPTKLPQAASFLWNKKMLMQVNCRGYVNSQFMQPEPSKYAYGPNIEAKTFIQPEHAYFSHHPGRFFYIKDEATQACFSAPYEPMRIPLDSFTFSAQDDVISWQIVHLDLAITIKVSLAENDVVERWQFTVRNLSAHQRTISIYPYFSIGYMSWMNQSASFDPKLNAIVADSVTPYQKVEDYFKNQSLKDKTFFVASHKPVAWHANQKHFEGEGGLHQPDALKEAQLANCSARYETPVAVMQFTETLAVNAQQSYQFLFGPAKDEQEIATLRQRYLGEQQQSDTDKAYQQYLNKGQGCLQLGTGKDDFDSFINHWLPRQMYYHGDVNRLSTDPQTRNYLQDNMGMCYINPKTTRDAFLLSASQQTQDGAMPDGILLTPEAELKYINQIPHADHCVWLPICLATYLAETNDTSLLSEQIDFADSAKTASFAHHIELALNWLLNATDERGLSLIEQGDWCDPMNMVGYKGKGVSTWLSLATAYALNTWCDLCEQYQIDADSALLAEYRFAANAINESVNKHLWQGNWFARGITDDGRVFGTEKDEQGKIFLNAQSWAMLSGAASAQQSQQMNQAISEQLITPYGAMMLAPSYTHMVEDVGRITQKHPGVSENGSIYNHAAVFYIYSLYQNQQADLAFSLLEKMLPDLDSCLKTGQLPVFVPNYYRGAYYQFPEHAGRSSHLFNTGTIAWIYRCLVEELCGLKGCANGLLVEPKLPEKLNKLTGVRQFRGASINFVIEKVAGLNEMEITLNQQRVHGNCLSDLSAGEHYQLSVKLQG